MIGDRIGDRRSDRIGNREFEKIGDRIGNRIGDFFLIGTPLLIRPPPCLPDMRLQLLFLLEESKHFKYLSNITYNYAIKLL